MTEGGSGPEQPPGRRPGEHQPDEETTVDLTGSLPDQEQPQPALVKPQVVPDPPKAAVLRSPTVRLEPATVSVAPGGSTVAVISITNRSDTIARFDVELEDESIGWMRPEPASVNLWKDESGEIQLVIAPPSGAHLRAGRLVVGVRITSRGIPEGSVSIPLAIEVTAVEAIVATMSPIATSGVRAGRHRVEVKNNGGAPWHARLTSTDPEEALVISATPAALMVPPYGSETVQLVVRPAKWHLMGGPRHHRFTLGLEPPTGPQKTIDGTFQHLPLIPRWTVGPATILAVLAILVVGGVLPPRPTPSPPPGESNTSAQGASANPAVSASPSPNAVPSSAPPSDSPPPPSSAPPSAAPSSPPPPSDPPPSTAPPSLGPVVADWAQSAATKLGAIGYVVGSNVGGTVALEDGWAVQAFENAIIYLSDEGQPKIIRTPILERWRLIGKVTSDTSLGYPTSDQKNVPVGFEFQKYEKGAIQCNAGKCYVVFGTVYEKWWEYRTKLGFPTADVVSQFLTGSSGKFDNGTISVDTAGNVTVCGKDGSTIEGSGPIGCGSGPPAVGG